MFPALGGDGKAKPAAGGTTLISKIFGTGRKDGPASNSSSESNSPRTGMPPPARVGGGMLTHSAPTGSAAEPAGKASSSSWNVHPSHAPSKGLQAPAAKLAPLTPSSASSHIAHSSHAPNLADVSADVTAAASREYLLELAQKLQKETEVLKQHIAAAKAEASGGGQQPTAAAPRMSVGGGRHRSPSVVVEFAAPHHQHRPSIMADSLKQPMRGRASTIITPMEADDEKDAFMECDEHEAAPAASQAKPAHAHATAPAPAAGSSKPPSEYSLAKGPSLDPLQAQKLAALAAAAQPKPKQPGLTASLQQAEVERKAAAAAAAAAKPVAAAAAVIAAVKPASSSSASAPRKYKLLSVFPLLEPSMRREEWSLSNFAIEKKLHAGYASEVYRAKDIQSGEMLAVKVYNLPQLGELNKVQLIREIRLHSAFVHRHIIELYCSFQENTRVILAQRYAEGGDLLRALHKAGGRLTERSAVQMVIQPLLNCLVYLHAKGITHRDIKPENILFDGEGVLKLADFGLAINMTEEKAVTRAGTLHYMAPEVVKNPLKDHPDDYKNDTRFHYNAVVDSWAVGCLAYELLVGFPPFMADTQQQVVANIYKKEVHFTKKMSEESVSFIKAALERNPENRATTDELIKNPWIKLHMRRNSTRNLQQLEAQSYTAKVVTDFASGVVMSRPRKADHGQGAKMAPF